MSAGTLRKIDNKLQGLDPQSLRHKVLLALRQFRSSWVELGRLLTEVAYGGDYKEWGYEDFEVYCARELGLKRPTVQKLMVSYNYMKKHEPSRLEAFEEHSEAGEPPFIPDYQTVELLHKARERGEDPEEADRFHTAAFDEEAEETDLRKEVRTYLRGDTDEAVRGANDARAREMQEILRAARRLRRLLATSSAVPGGLRERIDQILVELEALD